MYPKSMYGAKYEHFQMEIVILLSTSLKKSSRVNWHMIGLIDE